VQGLWKNLQKNLFGAIKTSICALIE